MKSTDLLLVLPPFSQLNTPYPSTAILKNFLTEKGFNVDQLDLGIESFLKLFSPNSLTILLQETNKQKKSISPATQRIINLKKEYISFIDPVISFLQGKDSSLANSIANGALPHSHRMMEKEDMDWHFGLMGVQDKAKYLATLFIEDIADFINEMVDDNFELSKYAEQLSIEIDLFQSIIDRLNEKSIISDIMFEILENRINETNPKTIGFSVPFPGNFFSAIQCADYIKKNHPQIKTILGGGYANTELRSLNETKLFSFFDFVCLDDGELPLMQLLKHLNKEIPDGELVRTFIYKNNQIQYINTTNLKDFNHETTGMPDYSGLDLNNYISVISITNPMHRLWSDGRWNKMMIAHGCYWNKCSFCDTSLDYIKRYSMASAKTLVDRVEKVIAQTNERGFHFVDEAAPPRALRNFAMELLQRNIKITWWTNIRFEESFTNDLCKLLATSGCIAVSGGLEVASNRLLQLMSKGVSVEQVAQVTHNFSQHGIMVHAYLMYGFPTQTAQETIDSLEVVRQLFELGLIQSGFWHRFALTIHSPIGITPDRYQINISDSHKSAFAQNGIPHIDPTGANHSQYSDGLKKALYNYMHGICFDYKLQEWFDFKVPNTTIASNIIKRAIQKQNKINTSNQVIWLNPIPTTQSISNQETVLIIETKEDTFEMALAPTVAQWLIDTLQKASISRKSPLTLKVISEEYERVTHEQFAHFSQGEDWQFLKQNGLIYI